MFYYRITENSIFIHEYSFVTNTYNDNASKHDGHVRIYNNRCLISLHSSPPAMMVQRRKIP